MTAKLQHDRVIRDLSNLPSPSQRVDQRIPWQDSLAFRVHEVRLGLSDDFPCQFFATHIFLFPAPWIVTVTPCWIILVTSAFSCTLPMR